MKPERNWLTCFRLTTLSFLSTRHVKVTGIALSIWCNLLKISKSRSNNILLTSLVQLISILM